MVVFEARNMAKILVAERAPNVRQFIAAVLGEDGHTLIEATNGNQALQKAAQELPELIIVDYALPTTTGLDVLGKLKDNPDTQPIPVIMMSESSRGESTALSYGAINYLIKPLEIASFASTIRFALRDAESLAALPDGSGVGSGRRLSSVIPTGFAQLDQMFRGGIPVGTLTLIDGSPSTGKSVLCQQITRQALRVGQGVAYFSSDHSSEELVAQMASMDMDPSRYLRNNWFRMARLEAPAEGTDPANVSKELVDRVSGVPAENPVIIIDSVTNIVRQLSPTLMVGAFSGLDQLARDGRTVLVVARSYIFDKNVLARLHALCHTHMTFTEETLGARTVKSVEVTKMRNVDVRTNNVLNFDVQQGVGIQHIPGGRIRV